MAFDKVFCPIKPNKSKDSKKTSPRSNKTHENVQSTIGPSSSHGKQTLTPYRYVKAAFDAGVADEISVIPGDVVLFQYTDSSENWSYVISLRTNKIGFVPSDILSSEQLRFTRCKKMPRYGDNSSERHLSHHTSCHKLPYSGAKPSTGEDNTESFEARMLSDLNDHHQPHHRRLNIPHSLQGSSGQQTLPKYPDLKYLCSTGYHNLNTSDSHCGFSEMEAMRLTDCGRYLVLHNFVAREEKDINVDPGEIVTVLNKDDPDWYWICRHDDRREGFVPANFMCQYEQAEAFVNKGNSTATMKSSNPIDFHTYINHRPESLKESLPADQQSVFLNV